MTASCDASLKRLGVDHIDLYYQHRVDLEQNAAATDLVLTVDDLARLAADVPADAVVGDRYPDMRTVER